MRFQASAASHSPRWPASPGKPSPDHLTLLLCPGQCPLCWLSLLGAVLALVRIPAAGTRQELEGGTDYSGSCLKAERCCQGVGSSLSLEVCEPGGWVAEVTFVFPLDLRG